MSCALKFAGCLKKLGIPFVCELYTEVLSRKLLVTPLHHGIEKRIPSNVILDARANRLEDFDVIPNLARYINGDPIETLRRMATADGLVISRSSYSYVAAILSANGIVVYHPFWHSPLREWLAADGDGVSEAGLMEQLECWKRDR